MKWNWRLSIMRVLVNGVAIYITAFIVPGIEIFTGTWQQRLLGIAVIGGVFGILNALIRPVIQFVALPLLFVSLGFVVVGINIVMLFVLNIVLPDLLHVDGLIPLIFGGILMGVLGMVLDGLLGLTPPLIDDEPESERETPLPPRPASEDVVASVALKGLFNQAEKLSAVREKNASATQPEAKTAVPLPPAETPSSAKAPPPVKTPPLPGEDDSQEAVQ